MEVKDRILVGAEEMFMRYGIKSITMDEIARHLSMSKKTIYQYYADKDEIVYRVCENHLNKEHCEIENLCKGASSAIQEMISISQHMRKELVNIHPTVLYDLKKFHPRAWELFIRHKEDIIEKSISDNLKRGIAEGYYRPEINVYILAKLRMEQVQLGFNPHVYPQDKFNMRDIQIQFLEHFIRGLLSAKGFEAWENYRKEIAFISE